MPESTFVARRDETDTFQQLIKKPRGQIWLIYGIGGIGKSRLLNEFSQLAAKSGEASLLLGFEHNQAAQTSAELILRSTTIDGRTAAYCEEKTPQSFIKLCKLMEKWRPIEEINNAITASDTTTTGLKLGLTAITQLWFNSYKNNPEKHLLEALAKDTDKTPLILLLDNHELAGQISIKTTLKHVSDKGTAQWLPGNTAEIREFYDWLEDIIRLLANRKQPLHLIITGRKRYQRIRTTNLSTNIEISKETLLPAFSQEDIKALVEKRLQDKLSPLKEDLNNLVPKIFQMTSGVPKLSIDLINLINSEYQGQLNTTWQHIENEYKANSESNFQRYVLEELADRVSHPAISRDNFWHLALPYRLSRENLEPLLTVLFPDSKNNEAKTQTASRIEALAAAGLLQCDPARSLPGKPHCQLHQLSKTTLLEYAWFNPQQVIKLHQKLHHYYENEETPSDKEAAAFHKFCANEGERLLQSGMPPETFWHLVKNSISLDSKKRREWLSKPLPKTEKGLNNRLQQLSNEQQKLDQDMAGDIRDFLRNRPQSAENQLRILDSPEKLDDLIKEAPNLSDLHFLKSQTLDDDQQRLDYLNKITGKINPFHPLAWFEQAILEHRMGSSKIARKAFTRAAGLGLSGQRQILAEAYLNWLNGNLDAAIDKFKGYQQHNLNSAIDPYGIEQQLVCVATIREQWKLIAKKQTTQHTENHNNQQADISNNQDPITYTIPKTDFNQVQTVNETQAAYNFTRVDTLIAKTGEVSEEAHDKEKEKEKEKDAFKNADQSRKKTKSQTGLTSEGHNTKKTAEELYALAHQQEADGDYLKAESSFKQSIDLENRPIDHYRLGALLAEHTTRFDEAENAYREAIRIDPQVSAPWYGLGKLLTEHTTRFDEAENAYREAIRIDPQFALPWHGLGLGKLLRQHTTRFDEAENAYREAIRIDPQFALPWHSLGKLLTEHTTRFDEAEDAFREAIRIDPQLAYSWHGLGNLLSDHTTRFDEAEDAYREAIRIDPQYANPLHALGSLLTEHTTRFDEAEDAYRESIRIDQQLVLPWNNLGILYSDKFNLSSKGHGFFYQALSLNPGLWAVWRNLGINHAKLVSSPHSINHNRFNDIALAGVALDKGKASVDQAMLIATEVWLKYQRWQELLETSQLVLQQDPYHNKALGLAAYACERMDDEQTQHYIHDALEQNPFQTHATFAKVNLLLKQGHKKDAITLLRQFYESDHSEQDYQHEMIFMGLFKRLKDTDYVWRSSQQAYQMADDESRWIPDYQLASYFWHHLQQLPKAEELIDDIKRTPATYGKHPAIDLLHAELAFVAGDMKTCEALLEKVKKAIDLPDDPVERAMSDTLTEDEMLRFERLNSGFAEVFKQCTQQK